MRLLSRPLILIAVALAGLGTGALRAQALFIPSTTATGTYGGDGNTVGGTFVVGASNLQVTQLGLWDNNSDGFGSSTNRVGIWDNSLSLVTSAIFPGSTTATLGANGYRYVSITPVTLTAGATYYLGYFQSTQNVDFTLVKMSGETVTYNSAIASTNFTLRTRFSFDAPTGAFDLVSGETYAGANFTFMAVPEPATYASLAGLSAFGVVLLRRRSIRRSVSRGARIS